MTARGFIGNIHLMIQSVSVCAMLGGANLMQERSKKNDMRINDRCLMIIQYKEVIRI